MLFRSRLAASEASLLSSHANRAIESDSTGNTFALLMVHPLQNTLFVGAVTEVEIRQTAGRDERKHIMDFTLLLLSNIFMTGIIYLIIRFIWQT